MRKIGNLDHTRDYNVVSILMKFCNNNKDTYLNRMTSKLAPTNLFQKKNELPVVPFTQAAVLTLLYCKGKLALYHGISCSTNRSSRSTKKKV